MFAPPNRRRRTPASLPQVASTPSPLQAWWRRMGWTACPSPLTWCPTPSSERLAVASGPPGLPGLAPACSCSRGGPAAVHSAGGERRPALLAQVRRSQHAALSRKAPQPSALQPHACPCTPTPRRYQYALFIEGSANDVLDGHAGIDATILGWSGADNAYFEIAARDGAPLPPGRYTVCGSAVAASQPAAAAWLQLGSRICLAAGATPDYSACMHPWPGGPPPRPCP